MEKGRSFSRYRSIDLVLFAVMLAVFETLAVRAARSFTSQPYSLSIVPAIVCLVIMRWGFWGLLHAAFGGLVYCMAIGTTARQYLVYVIGNLLCFAVVLLVRREGADKVRGSVALSVFMALAVTLSMQVGRGLVGAVLGNPPGVLAGYVLSDLLSGVFSVIVVLISRKLDGVLEDQKSYLLRLQRAEDDNEGYADEG